ncbi:hypothetical protein [Candidatus Viridilinea mediisalina]|uniref:hypothetical protein n=1 Tax=Candidatus Viridilinea mediisalina TaxID=2024553 RepID=UPI0013FD439A|nr:hypothetical protein [Candidatus Viridilinea mediisalina]
MTDHLAPTPSAPLGTIWPLIIVGIGVAGLFKSAQAMSEIVSILEWTGALGSKQEA